MSKYEPLHRFLDRSSTASLPMTFEEIERVLGFPLPPSARAHPSWWSNNTGTHVGVHAWRDAGWRTTRVDVGGERVVFVKEEPGGSASKSPPECSVGPIRLDDLTPAARRLVGDYTREMGGDAPGAIRRALHEAALAKRGRLIDQIVSLARPVSGDSTDLIRKDRDGR